MFLLIKNALNNMKDKKKIEIRIIFSFFKRFLRKLSPKIAFIIIDLITNPEININIIKPST